MRIALASIHPRPLSGQIEGLVGLAHSLRERGHAVTVVSAFPDDELQGPDRLQLASKPHRIFVDQPYRIAHVLRRLHALASQVDVIQFNLPTPAFSMFADWLQISVRVPVVVGYEAHLVRADQVLRRDRLGQAPDFYLPRLLINNSLVARLTFLRARRFVVHSRLQRDELMGLGVAADRICILPAVLPADKLRPGACDMRPLFPPGRILSYIGHYNHVKGVDVLLRAFQLLAPRVPDLTLAIAWSGIGRNRALEQLLLDPLLRDRVVELGRICVPDLLSVSDVVALPYRMTIGQAAYPAALIEALAARVPVVTTDLPLLRELTGEGQMAILVTPDDPAALAGAIECILSQPAVSANIRQAQEHWVRAIEPQNVVQDYEQLYREVTGEQARVLRTA